MSRIEQVLGAVVSWNNESVRRSAADRFAPNPRDVASVPWNAPLERSFPAIRAEWERFVAAGGGLPKIEELIDEHQGNEGEWRAGLLVSKGRPATSLARHFPQTVEAVVAVPGIWSALWSVLEPGTLLPQHHGPNAGVLRYHLGIQCPGNAALKVESTVVPYVEGAGILFDDTADHSAWNRSAEPRVTLFLEVLRPVHGLAQMTNPLVQRLIAFDPRYRRAPSRADEWERLLNGIAPKPSSETPATGKASGSFHP